MVAHIRDGLQVIFTMVQIKFLQPEDVHVGFILQLSHCKILRRRSTIIDNGLHRAGFILGSPSDVQRAFGTYSELFSKYKKKRFVIMRGKYVKKSFFWGRKVWLPDRLSTVTNGNRSEEEEEFTAWAYLEYVLYDGQDNVSTVNTTILSLSMQL